ncbi:MAG: ABC transporter permease [Candidatus Eremiobacteraeota bacterium]|nr:ABC transporter permease [Candidatus Eremiobacteraeota bacterium]
MKPLARDTFALYTGIQFRELWRDPLTAFFGLVFPLFFLLLTAFMTTSGGSFLFHAAVVAPDHEHAAALVRPLAELKMVQVSEMSEESAERALLKGDIWAIYQLPAGANAASGVHVVATQANLDLATLVLRAARDQADPARKRFGIVAEAFRHGEITQLAFAFPGIVALALLQLGVFATALPLLRARDRGVLLHLSLTPMPRLMMVASGILVRMLIACVQVAVICAVAVLFLHVHIAGNPFVFAALVALGTATMIAFGYALAGLARTYDSGLMFIMLTNFAMMFLGQVFWDATSNHALLPIVRLIPMTYIADALRTLAVGASGMLPLWADVAATAAWLALALLVATRTFRFDLSHR